MQISDSVRVMDGSGTDGNTVFVYNGDTYRGVGKYDDFDQCKDYW